MSSRPPRQEAGFTLLEVLLSIVILGIVLPVLGNTLWNVVSTSNLQGGQQIESHDAQMVSAYFSRDVASAGLRNWTPGAPAASFGQYLPTASVEVDVAPDSGVNQCGAAGDPNAAVRIAWNDFPTAGGTAGKVVVAYVAEVVGSRRHLHRIVCRDGSTTPMDDRVLARYLVGAPGATCSSTCTASTPPQEVSLTLEIAALNQPPPSFTVTLTGQRRQT